jgi:hypothetical protein
LLRSRLGVLVEISSGGNYIGCSAWYVLLSGETRGSREYRRYLEALERDPGFSLHTAQSVRYTGPDQLVEGGMMHDTPQWAEARGAARTPPAAALG